MQAAEATIPIHISLRSSFYMSSQNVFVKSFTPSLHIATTNAKPLLPSKVARQEAGAPFTFPLDDACRIKWKYLNFNPENDAHKVHLQKLHHVICIGEVRAISSWGAAAAGDSKTAINVVYSKLLRIPTQRLRTF